MNDKTKENEKMKIVDEEGLQYVAGGNQGHVKYSGEKCSSSHSA